MLNNNVEGQTGRLAVKKFTGQVSMTQEAEQVDPPLACPPVQLTLVFLVSAFLGIGFILARHPPEQSLFHGSKVLLEIDVNNAPPRELALLPGVGPVLAKRIAANRDRLGRFVSLEDLQRVHGIGPKTLLQVREYCVASDEQSQSIEVATSEVDGFDRMDR
ncbi:MAG: ComEA family DNA-binding protein [Rubripirellula sp.]